MKMVMKQYPLLICSHHKAGASYTVKTFKRIAQEFQKKLWMKFYEPKNNFSDWDICIHQHSRISELLTSKNFRGWHCIRHPKALIYSAVLYHQKCSEPWVDVPLEGFSSNTFWAASDGTIYNKIKNTEVSLEEKIRLMNSDYHGKTVKNFIHYPSYYKMKGKTYREYLSEMPSMREKVLFEMRSYSRGVIHDMMNFPFDTRFFTIKLEEISCDPNMNNLMKAFVHLGFEGSSLLKCLEIASSNCLWHIGKNGIGSHATTGMSNEWKDVFEGEVEDEYRKLFGWAEEAFGYCY